MILKTNSIELKKHIHTAKYVKFDLMFFDIHLFHSLIYLRIPGSGFNEYFHGWASVSTKNSKPRVLGWPMTFTCSHNLRKLLRTLGDTFKATNIYY